MHGSNSERLKRLASQFAGRLFRISTAKHRRTCDYPFGAVSHDVSNVFCADSAINFDVNIQAARFNHTPQPTYLVKRGAYKGLAAETRIYRHNQHVIDHG